MVSIGRASVVDGRASGVNGGRSASDVNGRALVVIDEPGDDDDLSTGVVQSSTVDLPQIHLWPVGDRIVVQFGGLRQFELCVPSLTKNNISVVESFHSIKISAHWRKSIMHHGGCAASAYIPLASVASLRLKESELGIVAEAHRIPYGS
ncbi:hypothetical protein PAXINDRAFT_17591 [Paxillus involutus ATCC 200175]|uniref:Uncharacterized protein n=1 Tax=Paxillus involutus ATCC 200175 TaxID=664439 RepID=A0A0C9T0S6_PAXIN|nr:hypothetical protein PAXINDRAFT_17591 [Paxillus involutus ATCC 200175]